MQRNRSSKLIAVTTVYLAATSAYASGDQTALDSLDQDYATQLPRVAPLEPDEAAKTFHLAQGFRIQLVAAEPLVADPVAMAFDEHGHLYVVEMRGYSENAEDNLGRIRLLKDINADGTFDRSHLFATGLSWPTAVACYDGGVFVGAAPDLLYFKDTDGDEKADHREVVLTGFGRENVQGLMNSLTWTLDNRIEGSTSSSGATLRDPNRPAEPPLTLRGRDFAFDPRTRRFEATSGGGQHGMSFNPWGEKFVCSNSNHIQMVTFEDRYVGRNPFLATPSPRVSIATDGPQADVFRTSPVEPWRTVRTRLRKSGLVPGPVERGGKAAGYFTSATGVTIFRGTAWPRTDSPWALIGDVGSNLVHRKRLRESGLIYRAERVDIETEFLSSSDIWFRPVQLANGPDGGLYLADMYRQVIEHPKSLPPIIKKHLDLTSGRDRGRIYRVVSETFTQPPPVDLAKADFPKLVETLKHPNGWHRETAARLLYERQDRSDVELLEKFAETDNMPAGRIRFLYVLASLDGLAPGSLLSALDSRHPRVRQHAVRLAERHLANDLQIQQKLCAMVHDPHSRVRYQVAFSLGEWSGSERNRALAGLIRSDGDDPLFQLAIQSSLGKGSGEVLLELTADATLRPTTTGQHWIRRLAKQIDEQRHADDTAAVLEVLRRLTSEDVSTMRILIEALAVRPGSDLAQQIAIVTGGQSDVELKKMIDEFAAVAADSRREGGSRAKAIHRLRLGRWATHRKLFANLLVPTESPEVQLAALRTMATFDEPDVANLVLETWPGYSPRIRRTAADLLLSRPSWIVVLLQAIRSKQVEAADLPPDWLKQLLHHPDPNVQAQARQTRGASDVRQRAEVVQSYRTVMEMKADQNRGKRVFGRVCASCHRAEGVGHEIGPRLAAVRDRGAPAMLLHVLDPNRELHPQYLNYTVSTTDGRTRSGMISAETASSITLKRAENETETILRVDIDQLRSTGRSFMPEGLEKEIDAQAMADLLAYLQSLP